jgi:hypothetical protein
MRDNGTGHYPPPKNRVIMYNLTYRLRKKGFRVITREKTIVAGWLTQPLEVRQVWRLVEEFNYHVQLEFN